MKRFLKHALWVIPVLAVICVIVFYIYCGAMRPLKETVTFCTEDGKTLTVHLDLEYNYLEDTRGTITYGDMTVEVYSQKEFDLIPEFGVPRFAFFKSSPNHAFAESLTLELKKTEDKYLYSLVVFSEYLGTETTVTENGGTHRRGLRYFGPATTGEEATQVLWQMYGPEDDQ